MNFNSLPRYLLSDITTGPHRSESSQIRCDGRHFCLPISALPCSNSPKNLISPGPPNGRASQPIGAQASLPSPRGGAITQTPVRNGQVPRNSYCRHSNYRKIRVRARNVRPLAVRSAHCEISQLPQVCGTGRFPSREKASSASSHTTLAENCLNTTPPERRVVPERDLSQEIILAAGFSNSLLTNFPALLSQTAAWALASPLGRDVSFSSGGN